MCGISGIVNSTTAEQAVQRMMQAQASRGPDAQGVYTSESKHVALGHNRLSIIDLSDAANQPMYSHDKRYVMVYNGEVYNYRELKSELKSGYNFTTESDSEVILAAYIRWGSHMLQKLNGMFALAIYDTHTHELFMARDRFGVKPLYYSTASGSFIFASEIKAIHASGLVNKEPNYAVWTTYFSSGLYDHSADTFWQHISALPAGCYATYANDTLHISRWYSLHENITDTDTRSEQIILDELLHILESTVEYRFRADVPVGICLSGGLDSSLLLALVNRVKGNDFPLHAFTFYTGDERYDELPWVHEMLAHTSVQHHACLLTPVEIPDLSSAIAKRMDEPFGGIPTLGMSKVFQTARNAGISVLLDGNGMDESWGGYEYYQRASDVDLTKGPVQGATSVTTLAPYLKPEIVREAPVLPHRSQGIKTDAVTHLQIRDLLETKIPRAMRFADRNSMTYSLELREPFLDYRLVELGLRQPVHHKINDGQGKYLIRKLADKIIPKRISKAPKRALQTPQREWLAHELKPWVSNLIEKNTEVLSYWFEPKDLKKIYEDYCTQKPDNSFYVWQIVNAILLLRDTSPRSSP